MLRHTNAQTSTPAANGWPLAFVPQYTLQFVDQPPNSALVITIKNQPYDSLDWSLCYNIRLKDHNSGNASWRYPFDQGERAGNTVGSHIDHFPEQSAVSNYTNISITVQSNLFVGGQNDIQVEALLGEQYPDPGHGYKETFFRTTSGWSSMQTITIPASSIPATITPNPTSTPTPTQTETPTPTPVPTVPEFSWLAILPLLISMLSIAVIIRHRTVHLGK
jgi:hypothetical protein